MKKTAAILLSLALAGSVTALPAAAAGLDNFKPGPGYEEGRFTDVQSKDWFSPHVASAYELGLLNGTGPDTFSPSDKVTLASAIALASRLHAVYHDGNPEDFNQSLGHNWYDTYVEYAAENGFLGRENYLDYNGFITREQFSGLLHAALPADAFEAVNTVEDKSIPDVDMDSDYAEAVYALYRAGILTGSGEDRAFHPEDFITRAELSAVTSRTADPDQRYQDRPESDPDEDDRPDSGGNGSGSAPQPPAETPEPPVQSPTPTPTPTPAPTPTQPPVTPQPPAETPDVPEQPAPTGEAEQILSLVNTARAQNGLSPLALDVKMVQAANVRAQETVSQFSHTRPDGSSFSTALTQAGVSFRAYGENIAWGQRSAEAVMDTWMNSSGHRANILSSSYSRLGVGVYRDANGTPYWVQLFCD